MNDALDPSPPAFEVVSLLNAVIDLPKNDKFVSRRISGDLYEISFNPRKKYTEGGEVFKWGNPNSIPTYGHTFSTSAGHSMRIKPQQLIDRARSKGHQVSQWLDDSAAAKFISEIAVSKGPGKHDIPLPSKLLGRSFLEDGTELSVDMVRVIVKPNGAVRTSFPFNSLYKN